MELTPKKRNEIKNLIEELDLSFLDHSIIQDNKIVFPVDDKIYRCRMPNQIEQTNAENLKNKLRINLIQEDGTITKKQLIKILKEKQDIDIQELENKKKDLQSKLFEKYLKLVGISSDKTEELEEVKDEINDLDIKFLEITYEIGDLLSPCIEEQIQAEYYRYLAHTCSEIQTGENEFKSVWETYDAFKKDDTGLSYKCIQHLHKLVLYIKE